MSLVWLELAPKMTHKMPFLSHWFHTDKYVCILNIGKVSIYMHISTAFNATSNQHCYLNTFYPVKYLDYCIYHTIQISLIFEEEKYVPSIFFFPYFQWYLNIIITMTDQGHIEYTVQPCHYSK